jgi:fructose-1,6-bisphosphatase/sedoheptulose 1,7-bisphosphatase-like protein
MMSLAWPLFRITEQAALAAWPQTGCGDKNKIDGLAVTAMREALNSIGIRGRIVIGEGRLIEPRCCGLVKRWETASGLR